MASVGTGAHSLDEVKTTDNKNKTNTKDKKKKTLIQKVFIESRSLRVALVNFLLAYNIRAGLSLFLRILTLARKGDKSLFSVKGLVSEDDLKFRVEAVQMGMFVGSYSFIYKSVMALLYIIHKKKQPNLSKLNDELIAAPSSVISEAFTPEEEEKRRKHIDHLSSFDWWYPLFAGSLAGSSLALLDKSWHRTLALYMATRAMQCFYNFSKQKGYFHFWGSNWNHGDSLLFVLSSAQVMYAYVMNPQTLPPSYYRFIRTQGPLDEVVLQAVRDNCRDLKVDTTAVIDYVKKGGGEEAFQAVKPYLIKPDGSINQFPVLIPARVMHPYTKYGTLHSIYTFWGVAKQIFPVYLSLAFVPAVVLRFRRFSQSPLGTLTNSILSAIQSTTFLASLCGSYQVFILIQRFFLQNFLPKQKDNKLIYYVAGLVSCTSILIERKSRRSELALYAFPRAADSLYQILNKHQLVFPLPQGEILLFMASMGICLFFFEHDRDTLSPLVSKVLERFLPDTKNRTEIAKKIQENLKSSRSRIGLFDDNDSETNKSSLGNGKTIFP